MSVDWLEMMEKSLTESYNKGLDEFLKVAGAVSPTSIPSVNIETFPSDVVYTDGRIKTTPLQTNITSDEVTSATAFAYMSTMMYFVTASAAARPGGPAYPTIRETFGRSRKGSMTGSMFHTGSFSQSFVAPSV